MSEISIILPLYNGEKYIKGTIEKIKSQSFRDWELIIVDDGSTDSGLSIASQEAESNCQIKVFHKENGGICSARNYGIEKASGKYISFVDQDDEPLVYCLESLYSYAEQGFDLVVGGQDLNLIDSEGNIIESKIRAYEKTIIDDSDTKAGFMFNRCNDASSQHVWNCLYRSEIVIKNKIRFDEHFKRGLEDFMFNFEYALAAERIIKIPEVVYSYKRRADFSTSMKPNPNALDDYTYSINKMYSYIDRENEALISEFQFYAFRWLVNSYSQNKFSDDKVELNRYLDFYTQRFSKPLKRFWLKNNMRNRVYCFLELKVRKQPWLLLTIKKIRNRKCLV